MKGAGGRRVRLLLHGSLMHENELAKAIYDIATWT